MDCYLVDWQIYPIKESTKCGKETPRPRGPGGGGGVAWSVSKVNDVPKGK